MFIGLFDWATDVNRSKADPTSLVTSPESLPPVTVTVPQQEEVEDPRMLVRVLITGKWEAWYIPRRYSGRRFQERLDARLGVFRDNQPPVWIGTPEKSDVRAWMVYHQSRRWRGEDLIELGSYEIRG
jgi:hypothetical protein